MCFEIQTYIDELRKIPTDLRRAAKRADLDIDHLDDFTIYVMFQWCRKNTYTAEGQARLEDIFLGLCKIVDPSIKEPNNVS